MKCSKMQQGKRKNSPTTDSIWNPVEQFPSRAMPHADD